MNQQTLIIGIAVVAIAGVTFYEGRQFDRWGEVDPYLLAAMGEKIQRVPKTIGDWESQDVPLDAKSIEVAEIHSYISRKYRHRVTKAEVDVLLVCGPTKPMVVHNPELCYAAVGFTEDHRDTKELGQESRSGKFFNAAFTRDRGAGTDKIDILWAWTTTGEWKAPSSPQLEYGAVAALYKLYAISALAPSKSVEPANSAFMREFLPVLDKTLFPEPQPPSEG